tara:strand:+ start:2470 stop:2997 length:528 start_codon:yes stop_codon:yes gene_type:complete
MMVRRIFLLFIIAFGTSSCTMHRMERLLNKSMAVNGTAQMTSPGRMGPIHFEKTACFGRCTAFQFTWNEDNTTDLEITRPFLDGPLSTLESGKYQGQLSTKLARKLLQSLDAEATACGYETLANEYDNPRVTDLPSTITEIGGKRVQNRYGGPNLNKLYSAFQEILDQIEWAPID